MRTAPTTASRLGPIRRSGVLLSALSLFAAAATACGSDGDGGGGGDGGTMSIRISNPANVSNVPLNLAIAKGYFKDEGLDVTADVDLGAGNTIEAVVGGDVDMAWSNIASVIATYAAGLPIELVRVTDTAVPGNTQILVAGDSDAQDLTDLYGGKLAVLSSITTCVWLIKNELLDAGEDPDTISFVEVPPPDHAAALESGNVDATCTADPGKTAMVDGLGARPIYDLMVDSPEEFHDNPVGGYVVSQEFAESNADALDAFQRAMDRAMTYANDNPDEVRSTLVDYAGTDPGVAQEISINNYLEDSDLEPLRERLQSIVDVMLKTGVLDKGTEIDVDAIVTGG